DEPADVEPPIRIAGIGEYGAGAHRAHAAAGSGHDDVDAVFIDLRPYRREECLGDAERTFDGHVGGRREDTACEIAACDRPGDVAARRNRARGSAARASVRLFVVDPEPRPINGGEAGGGIRKLLAIRERIPIAWGID